MEFSFVKEICCYFYNFINNEREIGFKYVIAVILINDGCMLIEQLDCMHHLNIFVYQVYLWYTIFFNLGNMTHAF